MHHNQANIVETIVWIVFFILTTINLVMLAKSYYLKAVYYCPQQRVMLLVVDYVTSGVVADTGRFIHSCCLPQI